MSDHSRCTLKLRHVDTHAVPTVVQSRFTSLVQQGHMALAPRVAAGATYSTLHRTLISHAAQRHALGGACPLCSTPYSCTVSLLLADPTRHTSTYTPSGSRPRISEVSSRVVLTWRWRGWRAARGYRGHQTLHHWPSSGPPRSAHDRSPCRRLPPSPSCWPCAALAVKVRVPR
jgi:hypothetical protein